MLFADVVGFSTLAERLDPEAVHTIMDGCFEILTRDVHRHEGTINQFTGDGIMALFGAPIAHEDHAVRALQAALSVQAEVVRYGETVQRRWGVPFQMRIGVNTGTVVVGRIGDNLRMDYTAQGDTTNLAARLQQMAPPGAIWVGETTYRVAEGAFEWRPVGPIVVKGRETPAAAYELVGRRAVRSRFDVQAQRGLTRFVGRDPEFQQLLSCWSAGHAGAGASGVGGGGGGAGQEPVDTRVQAAAGPRRGRVSRGLVLRVWGDDLVSALHSGDQGGPGAGGDRRRSGGQAPDR